MSIQDYTKQHQCEEPWYRFFRIISALKTVVPEIPRKSTWLDLGCHQGQFLSLIAEKYQIQTTGLDVWNESLAGDNFQGRSPNTPRWKYNQRDLAGDFQLNEKFDFISALEVIEHIIDTDNFLENCWHYLNEGGYLILSTPNINSLRNRVSVPLGKYPAGIEYRNVIHHVRLYNVPCIKSHLTEHNFKLNRVLGVNFFPHRYVSNSVLRPIEQNLANQFPQLCGNIIVICQKLPK
jgi:2-polyprenyl-3-methyl-5-hydroxy-6-metoxy-1,4-benzoquinol methylase